MAKPLRLEALNRTAAQRELFNRFFDHMGDCEPQVKLRDFGITLVEEIRNQILSGEPVVQIEGTWPQIFAAVSLASEGDPSCGASLLAFIGHLGDATRRFGPLRVPITWALMGLMWSSHEPPYPTMWNEDEEGWGIVVTPFGVNALGVTGRVSIARRIPVADSPPELFDRLCTQDYESMAALFIDMRESVPDSQEEIEAEARCADAEGRLSLLEGAERGGRPPPPRATSA
ncbi:hypothetical protein JNW90_33595 [Micromonospora sp. STR1s_5]|nr:hypothetical protein [Micromonospora sp. STR1s_5]